MITYYIEMTYIINITFIINLNMQLVNDALAIYLIQEL